MAAACASRDGLAREAVRHIWGMELELSEVDTKVLAVTNIVRLYVLPGVRPRDLNQPNREAPGQSTVGRGWRTVSHGDCSRSKLLCFGPLTFQGRGAC